MSRKLRIFSALLWPMATLGLAFVLVTILPINSWIASRLAGNWEDPKGDVLIVLSGGEIDDGIMSENSLLRSYYAVLIYKQRGFRQIIVTGGGSRTPISESMKEFLILKGIPKDAVLTEIASSSTRESAVNLKQVLDRIPGKKVLLTSDYHMFRSRRAFEKVGLSVMTNPVPDALKRTNSWSRRWPVFIDLVSESGKIIYYYFRGWI